MAKRTFYFDGEGVVFEQGEVFIMIKQIDKNDIVECVKVIRKSFRTVADEFGFNADNAPRFTAFATTKQNVWSGN